MISTALVCYFLSILPSSLAAFSYLKTIPIPVWNQESNRFLRQHVTNRFSTYRKSTSTGSIGTCQMVRNIDLVEALIFYGDDAIVAPHDGDSNMITLAGVQSLLDECQRDDTAVIAIVDDETTHGFLASQHPSSINLFTMTRPPPNPKDLWEAIHSIPPIQPKGFGGSSGFGMKAADPERGPLPKHCVVLCTTEHQCRAARYAGMRVVCLTDNPLADAVVDYDWSSLCMDDIATPGSFWLNPPHPRDDKSNAVDVDAVIQAYETQTGSDVSNGSKQVFVVSPVVDNEEKEEEELSKEQLAKLLADIDPL